MEKKEAIQIKSELGCISRRLFEIYNNAPNSDTSGSISAAAQGADEAYEAMKRVLEDLGEAP